MLVDSAYADFCFVCKMEVTYGLTMPMFPDTN
jgi:hypothetical protein